MNQIEPEQERRELSTVVQLMAGLQYKKEVIKSIFREVTVMYQEILKEGEQKGRKEGLQQGRQEGELTLIDVTPTKAVKLIPLDQLGNALNDFTLTPLHLR